MLFGHNTNVTADGITYHIQTEDRGPTNALIDTIVYFRGRVLYRRTNNYFDLLPLDLERGRALKVRLDEQHRAIIEEIRTGSLQLSIPREKRVTTSALGAPVALNVLRLELLNAKTWLTGKRALLQIAVRDQSNKAVEGAEVTVRVEGAAEPAELSNETGPFGHAQFEFDMPRLSGAEPALLIEVAKGNAKGQLRFQMRARPRVPSER